MDLFELNQLMLCVGPVEHEDTLLFSNEEQLSCIAKDMLMRLDGNFLEKDVSLEFKYGRRPMCLVRIGSNPMFVVKFDAGMLASSVREYESLICLREILSNNSRFVRIPNPVSLSKTRNAFMYDYIDGESYSVICSNVMNSDKTTIEKLGEVMRCIHNIHFEEGNMHNFGLSKMSPPWQLNFCALTTDQYARGVGEDFHAYQALIRSCEPSLEEMVENWSCDAIIHGDLRFDNIIVAKDGTPIVIDWELAALGDPHYDIGYFVSEFIFESICLGVEGISDSWFQKTITFLKSYLEYDKSSFKSSFERVDLFVKYAALSLLHKLSSLMQNRGHFGRIGYKTALCVNHILSNSNQIAFGITRSVYE